jgi:hypothetical protein
MKNKLLHRILIILIVVGIVIASIIAVKAIMIKKVNSIKETTADQFKQKLSDKGYYISSSMNEQSPKYLKTAYTAISKDQTYDIKFYEAQTDEDALTNIFLKEKEAIAKESNKKVLKDIKIKQYNYYEVIINDKIYIVIRNSKTVIITKIEQNKEKEIKSILKEFNYIL